MLSQTKARHVNLSEVGPRQIAIELATYAGAAAAAGILFVAGAAIYSAHAKLPEVREPPTQQLPRSAPTMPEPTPNRAAQAAARHAGGHGGVARSSRPGRQG